MLQTLDQTWLCFHSPSRQLWQKNWPESVILVSFQIFYFRVGEGELSVTILPDYVLHYCLKNAQSLTELVTVEHFVVVNFKVFLKNVKALQTILKQS